MTKNGATVVASSRGGNVVEVLRYDGRGREESVGIVLAYVERSKIDEMAFHDVLRSSPTLEIINADATAYVSWVHRDAVTEFVSCAKHAEVDPARGPLPNPFRLADDREPIAVGLYKGIVGVWCILRAKTDDDPPYVRTRR